LFRLEPMTFTSGTPMTLGFRVNPEKQGPGIYRVKDDGYEFIGSLNHEGIVQGEIRRGGIFALGYDAVAPAIRLLEPDADGIAVSVTDNGSGIDTNNLSVTFGGRELEWSYDEKKSTVSISVGASPIAENIVFTMTVSDRAGNSRTGTFTVNLSAIPGRIFIEQNSPNPFNPITHIPFTLTSDGRVRIEIYDMLGRKIRTLADSRFSAGHHMIAWDARDDSARSVSSGVYLYTVSFGAYSETRKMLFIR